MNEGAKKIASKGFCIYCQKLGLVLTDEHIVPYFIGGQHIILEASCKDCARITSKFELEVARNLWGQARTCFDAPSRRKKHRPKYVEISDKYSAGSKIKIPVNEYPAPMIFYKMNSAGILMGYPEYTDQSKNWELIAIHDDAKVKEFEKKYPGQLTTRIKHVPDSFARLIAKIGFGDILTHLDPQDFNPICVPYILGEKNNYSYVVGGRWSIPDPEPNTGYKLQSYAAGNSEKILLISEIRLVANAHTPVYHVVVGDVSGVENVDRVIEKFGMSGGEIHMDVNAAKNNKDDLFHWVPKIWPLLN